MTAYLLIFSKYSLSYYLTWHRENFSLNPGDHGVQSPVEGLAFDKIFDGNLPFKETEGEVMNAGTGKEFSSHRMPKRRKFLLVLFSQ